MAFEPVKEQYEKLCSRLKGKALTRRVALGAQAGFVDMNLWSDGRVSSILEVHSGVKVLSSDFAEHDVQNVQLSTIDAEIQNLGIMPDLVKLDVQGYELAVLQGAESALKSGQIAAIACEVNFASAYVNQCRLEDLVSFMTSYEYRLWNIDRLVHTSTGNLYFGDFTFVSRRSWELLGAT